METNIVTAERENRSQHAQWSISEVIELGIEERLRKHQDQQFATLMMKTVFSFLPPNFVHTAKLNSVGGASLCPK